MVGAEKSCDVLVIGAGIIGCTVAHALVLRGLEVGLIDAGPVGAGTSSASFSWINATSKFSDPEYFRLNVLGLRRYLDLGREWGEETIGLHQSGMIEWADADDVARVEALRAAAEQLNACNYPARWVDRNQLEQLEPNILFKDGAEGYFVENDCWLDAPLFLEFLVKQLKNAGTDVIEHCRAVELIASEEGRVLGVQTERDRFTCSSVVLATGANTPEALSQLTGYDGFRSRFPLRCAPGLLVTTPPSQKTFVGHVVYSSHASGLHFRNAGEGRLLVGADDTDGLVSENNTEDGIGDAARLLLNRVATLIPDFGGAALLEQCQLDVGVRAVPVDGRSIAGPALSAEGLYIVVTHSGITLAPVLAELVADCIETGKIPEQLNPFSLDRFDA